MVMKVMPAIRRLAVAAWLPGVAAEQPDRARGGGDRRGHHAQQGGLARPVRAQQAEDPGAGAEAGVALVSRSRPRISRMVVDFPNPGL
jgi:hypothetical protein